MDTGHWLWRGEPFDVSKYCGFVYIVRCTHPDERRLYIGRKFFHINFGKKRKQKEGPWKKYLTSSANVKDAIKKYGKEYFEFHIVSIYETRAGVVNAEVQLQWHANVLHSEYEEGKNKYWNGNIGAIKFIAKEKVEKFATDFIDRIDKEQFE
jgi:phosphoribosyl-ATP pyrophosphohydrolase